MPVSIEHILLRDEWTEADRLAIRNAVEADPDLGLALRRWFQLGNESSRAWERDVPARSVLVLLACRDRFDASDLSQEEQAQLKEAAAALDTVLERHPAVDDILKRIRQEATAFEQAWSQSFESSRAADRGPLDRSTGRPSGPLRLIRMAVAAAAIIAILVVGRSYFGSDSDGPMVTYTAQNTMQFVSLDDGSTVRLAPSATLDVLYDDASEERLVRLDGQGFFDIAAGPRPFRVETANAITTVLGTTFGLRTDEGTEVTLVTGRVSLASLSSPDAAVILTPGEQGILPAGMEQAEVRTFSMLYGFDWSGLLVFRNTPMSTVAERLSDEFEVDISVSDDLSEAPLTGTFESDRGSKAILDIIASALGAKVTENEDGSFHIHIPAGS
jgi:ferric-dicitrate binding protein FerR (iron transport regulator)